MCCAAICCNGASFDAPAAAVDIGHRDGAARTGEPAEEAPGTVVRADESGAVVAAADERLVVEQVRVDGEHAAPAAVLRPGLRLVADPAPDEWDGMVKE